MTQETLFAAAELLDAVTQLLDESSPDTLLPKMIGWPVKCCMLRPLFWRFWNPLIAFRFREVCCYFGFGCAVVPVKKIGNSLESVDDDSADLSKSVIQNQLTSILVAPFAHLIRICFQDICIYSVRRGQNLFWKRTVTFRSFVKCARRLSSLLMIINGTVSL
jgi:hypothetical protein